MLEIFIRNFLFEEAKNFKILEPSLKLQIVYTLIPQKKKFNQLSQNRPQKIRNKKNTPSHKKHPLPNR